MASIFSGLRKKVKRNSHDQQLIQNLSATSSKPSVYNSIHNLPLHNFIEIAVTNDLKGLVIEGNPDNLDEVWENIFNEYSEAVQDGSVSNALRLAIQISFLTNRLSQIQQAVSYLNIRRCDAIIECLKNDYGFRLQYIDLRKDLERTIVLCKSDEVKLAKAIKEYESLTEKTEQSVSRSDFTSNLVSLSKYLGFMPNKMSITVGEYVEMLKDFKRNNTPKNGG